MSKQILENCAACGEQWKNRKSKVYSTYAKTIPMIFGMQLLSHHGKKRIQLMFCDKHGNSPYFRHVNGTNVLQIRNVKSNRWRNAEKIGVVV